ncbi:hypothetical protein [Pseudomonas sp. SDO5271_S396]
MQINRFLSNSPVTLPAQPQVTQSEEHAESTLSVQHAPVPPPKITTQGSSTTEHSKLDRVSDPKLEIKKVATAPNGLFHISYSLPAPAPGLSNITFPMSIDAGLQRKSAKDGGNYFAMQFGVNDKKGKHLGTGYIGMQPRGDGKALIVFSGFGPHFSAPKGRSEADGGKGGSNSTLVDFKFGHKYNLTVERDPENAKRLKAYIQDVTDANTPGPKQHVKDLDVDKEVALAGHNTGFVEHYGAKIDRSSQIATVGGSFSAPFTQDDKGNIKTGSIKSDGLYGRYKNAMVGNQEITREAGKGKEIKFSLQGVGYEKKS